MLVFSNTSSLTIFILGSGESRDSAKEPRHVADTDIRLGWKFNFFPSISRLFLSEGSKVYSQIGLGYGRIPPGFGVETLNPPKYAHGKNGHLVVYGNPDNTIQFPQCLFALH